MAKGREEKFQLRTKKDKTIPKSIITQEKADLTQGTIMELPAPMELKDFNGVMYLARSLITLRCQYEGSPQSFDETFYVVDSCELDALLQRNISKSTDKPNCLPLYWSSQTGGTQPRRR